MIMSLSTITRNFIRRIKSINRNLGQGCEPNKEKKKISKISEICFNLSGYNKYGLYTDDILYHANPDVIEAVKRLPKDVQDARNYRGIRAMHLSLLRTYLPKEKWITYEQDLENRYLQPYIDEVQAERREIEEFGCTNYRADAHYV